MSPKISAFVQARMSSTRFPGKVLVPFRGKPIINHVLETVQAVPSINETIVLTSTESSDDPLVDHLHKMNCNVFRGSLLDVFSRFQLCAIQNPCDWVLRICADSPLLRPEVLREVVSHVHQDCDVVTTRFNPPFPKGQNLDLVATECLLKVNPTDLTDYDREHVTPWFYRNRESYRIVDAQEVELALNGTEFTVDTIEDLQRLEQL